eukprot:UN13117
MSNWSVKQSRQSAETVNPIRDIVDKLDFNNLPKDYALIQLSIGDPSKYGNLPVPKSALRAVTTKVLANDSNGYLPSVGDKKARDAISARYTSKLANASKTKTSKVLNNFKYTAKDVFITSG